MDKKETINFNVLFRDDGYINLTKLCKSGGKEFKNWYTLNKTKEFIKILSNILFIDSDKLIIIGKNRYNNTWGHPQIAINIAQWISSEFSIKVSEWVFEWYNQNDKNRYEFETEINNLKPSFNVLTEKNVKNNMHKRLGGDVEVITKYGNIDLLTKDEVIEIKEISDWKHAIGQVISYSSDKICLNKTKRIHLFSFEDIDDDKINIIKEITDINNIKLTYEKV